MVPEVQISRRFSPYISFGILMSCKPHRVCLSVCVCVCVFIYRSVPAYSSTSSTQALVFMRAFCVFIWVVELYWVLSRFTQKSRLRLKHRLQENLTRSACCTFLLLPLFDKAIVISITFNQQSFAFLAPSVWNSLPADPLLHSGETESLRVCFCCCFLIDTFSWSGRMLHPVVVFKDYFCFTKL